MNDMLRRQVLLLFSFLTLGLFSGCKPIDASYNQDNPAGPPVWPVPDPVYETPRQYGGVPFIDLGYYDQQPMGAVESTSPSAPGPSGPEPTGSSTAASEGEIR